MTGQVVRYAKDFSAARQVAALGAALAAALLLFVGIRLLALPFPVLITSLILFARMAAPAQALQQTVQQIAAYAPAFAAIERRLGTLEQPRPEQATVRPLEWTGLRLDGAAFEHQSGLGVRSASLTLGRGEWLGLSGPSGAGKTTLVDLVAGLLPSQRGSIAVDGRPLQGELLEGWRLGLAYVGQEGTVFNDSVRANLVAEGSSADDSELWRALELVGLAAGVSCREANVSGWYWPGRCFGARPCSSSTKPRPRLTRRARRTCSTASARSIRVRRRWSSPTATPASRLAIRSSRSNMGL
jgi:ATP-binding cassette subfamily C protein